MTKIRICLGEGGADDVVVSLDTSAFEGQASGKPDSNQVTEALCAEYVMKISGTYIVKDAPVNPNVSYPGLRLDMFPGAENGQILLEGQVTTAKIGKSYDQQAGVLITDDGEIYPDDLLFGRFTGQRVQVIKSNDGILVRKVKAK